MKREYSKNEFKALEQLAGFRDIFYQHLSVPGSKIKNSNNDAELKKSAHNFIEIFCENNFADTDYSIIQLEPREFETADLWINQINIDTVLKCLTYLIWNNKIYEGYCLKIIKDGLVVKHLSRLKNIVEEQKPPIKLLDKDMGAVVNFSKEATLQTLKQA